MIIKGESRGIREKIRSLIFFWPIIMQKAMRNAYETLVGRPGE
jgi:hypothetical protein